MLQGRDAEGNALDGRRHGWETVPSLLVGVMLPPQRQVGPQSSEVGRVMMFCEDCGACVEPTYRTEDGEEHLRRVCPQCRSGEVRYATA